MNEKAHDLAAMLKQIAPDEDLDVIEDPALEGFVDTGLEEHLQPAQSAMEKLKLGQELAPEEMFGLEAIIMPKYRPAIDIVNNNYKRPPSPWEHFGNGKRKARMKDAIPSIGRIELPDHPSYPYGGTGFVVGEGLLMTNRHVAAIFSTGLGRLGLAFRDEQKAGIDFLQEVGNDNTAFYDVVKVAMIHPFWDMAILKVDGLERKPLKLSVAEPNDLVGKEIAVIGYPAQDPRNDAQLQMQLFRGQFNVKRLLPGKLRTRQTVNSIGNRVSACTHDASTLGGNSGSAMVMADSGMVIGLHFGGRYLKANYAVPTRELARDARVVELGLNFESSIPKTGEWDAVWRRADPPPEPISPSPVATTPTPFDSPSMTSGETTTMKFNIPIEISVSVGAPISSDGTPLTPDSGDAVDDSDLTTYIEALKQPVMFPNIENRKGYDPDFLEAEAEVPLPKITRKGKEIAAPLSDGSLELKYHKFSVVMHKDRRLALFTAANVDWRPHRRKINGKKPTRKQLTGLRDGDHEKWALDSRISAEHQLPDVFFTKDRKAFHKGHIVRRHDVCWGSTFKDIQKANGDTYHTTNCSPQVPKFNSAMLGDMNWGELENMIQKQTKAEKAIVFAGPVFRKNDPFFDGVDMDRSLLKVKIPRAYWKIVVTAEDGELEAFGFVLRQDLSDVDFRAEEMMVPDKWRTFMEPISEITRLLNGWAKFDFLEEFDQFEVLESFFNEED